MLCWGAWLAQLVEHVTQNCEFKPHTRGRAYLKKNVMLEIANLSPLQKLYGDYVDNYPLSLI